MKRQYKTDKTRWRFCDHPRIPSNTVASGRGFTTCRTCKRERDGKRWAEGSSRESGRRRRLPTHRRMPLVVLEMWRPLPIVDTSGRAYSMFPPKVRTA